MSSRLICACVDGNVAIVEELLRTDCDAACSIDFAAPDGTTALMATIIWGHTTALRILLDYGAGTNVPVEGTQWTPLHAAALQESEPMCALLLAHRADPHLQDEYGRSPIDYASAAQEELWQHFAKVGCTRSSKEELIAKSIIRKVEMPAGEPMAEGAAAANTGAEESVQEDWEVLGSSQREAVHEGFEEDEEVAAITTKVSAMMKPVKAPSSSSYKPMLTGAAPALDHYSRPGSAYVKYNKGGPAGMPPPPPSRAGRPLAHGVATRTVRASPGVPQKKMSSKRDSGTVNIMTLA